MRVAGRAAGVNVLALQRMLGHKSAKVTLDTYADLFDDDLDAVAAALDKTRGMLSETLTESLRWPTRTHDNGGTHHDNGGTD